MRHQVGGLIALARAAVRGFFEAPSWAIDLAVVRIAVFGALLLTGVGDPNDIVWYASLPEGIFQPPPGWDRLFYLVPRSALLAVALKSLFLVTSGLAMLGLRPRISGTLSALTALYVLGLPQFVGKLNHYHHLIWFACILALSPCADALALDHVVRKTVRRAERPAKSAAYGFPIRLIWLLIGFIYWFPGFWKLATIGPEWASGLHLRAILYQRWTELGGFVPIVRIDQFPALLTLMASSALVFELCFLPALFARRVRWLFVAMGLAFHFGTWVTMRIHFLELVVCYVAFVPWGSFRGSSGIGERLNDSVDDRSQSSRLVVFAGTLIVMGATWTGAQGIDSWPFAVYPRFAYHAPPLSHRVRVQFQPATPGDSDHELLQHRFDVSRWSAIEHRLLRARPDAPIWTALDAVVTNRGDDARQVVYVHEVLWNDPARWAENPADSRAIRGIRGSASQR